MNCEYCKSSAPENIKLISKTWVCPICTEKPFVGFVPLKVELGAKYDSCIQLDKTVRLVYISDISNNLWKIEQYFKESVAHNRPCTITLILADAYDRLVGEYDGVYIDNDIIDKDLNANQSQILINDMKQNIFKYKNDKIYMKNIKPENDITDTIKIFSILHKMPGSIMKKEYKKHIYDIN